MQISPLIISVPTECKSRKRKELSIIQLVSQEIFLSLIVFYRNTPKETERLFDNTSQWKPGSKPAEEAKKKKNARKRDFTDFKWLQVGFTSLKFSHLNVRHLVLSVQLWFLNSHQPGTSTECFTPPTLGWAGSPSIPTFLILLIAEEVQATSLAISCQKAECLIAELNPSLHSKAFRRPQFGGESS